MKPIELLIVVSDIHCGSVVGLAPPETTTAHGNVIGFGKNIHQEWLWNNWVCGISQVKQLVNGSSAALIVNGDATEGSHHRNDADLVASDIEVHTNMAVECLKPLSKLCQRAFVVKGTECHTQNMENVLAGKLGAMDGIAKNKWLIRLNGVLIDAAHHMTVTSRVHLEASAMSILMGNARLNYQRAGHEVPRIFLRAHRHCGGKYDDGHSLFGVTGAWQMLTRHGFKVVTDSIPRPSIMVLDWRNRKKGDLPDVREIKFDPPQDEITSI